MSNIPARTPEGDAKFFAALENAHSVNAACEAAGYARRSVYRWRKEDKAFAEAWDDALTVAADMLEEEADRRGRDGYDEPVFYQGEQVGAKRKYSDALLLARLKAVRPERYRERIPATSADNRKITIVIRDFTKDPPVLEATPLPALAKHEP